MRSDFNTADQPADARFHQACTPQAHPGCAYPAESTIYGPLSSTYQSNPTYHAENLNEILKHTSLIVKYYISNCLMRTVKIIYYY